MTLAFSRLFGASTQRIEVIALALLVCIGIFELVRRKRLLERYAIVWLVAGVCVLLLALWKGLLTTLAHAAGIYYPPSALFAVIFLFVLIMLVNFSITVSRLTDQNHVLAQRLALLQRRVEEGEPVPGEPVPGEPVSGERPPGAPARPSSDAAT